MYKCKLCNRDLNDPSNLLECRNDHVAALGKLEGYQEMLEEIIVEVIKHAVREEWQDVATILAQRCDVEWEEHFNDAHGVAACDNL